MHACAQLDTFHSEMESLELTAREEAAVHQPRGARYAGPDDMRDMSKAHTFLLDNQVKLGGKFKLDLEYVPGKQEVTVEHECSPSVMDMMYMGEPVIDVFQVLHQQIFLMVPEKHICSEECKGLCPSCGVNLNTDSCNCKKDLKSSPFDVLKNL